jgi:FixJ family two-component response regulator
VTIGTVYLVDDDASVRRSMGRLLDTHGLDVVIRRSADEFLAIESIRHPMCLVADIQMPGRTGFELLELLRSSGRECPVVLITGYADAGMLGRSLDAGAVAVLVKPIDEGDLLDAIAEGLSRDEKSER